LLIIVIAESDYRFFAPGTAVVCVWLSCFVFAFAAACPVAATFCFWSRCFAFGDLSPMYAPIDGLRHRGDDRRTQAKQQG
jgi:hypothetical protein